MSLKRRFGFASGVIRSGDELLARCKGICYLPDHQGMRKGEGSRAGVLDKLVSYR